MTQLRIGDAERDAAAAALGEHYAAGRLTKDEHDERIDQVWAAKYDGDLAPVFADLPGRGGVLATSGRSTGSKQDATTRMSRPPARRPGPPAAHPLMLLGPIAFAAIIATVIATGSASWLFLLFFLWCFGGMGRRRHHGWAQSR
jgi:hypothetical protein